MNFSISTLVQVAVRLVDPKAPSRGRRSRDAGVHLDDDYSARLWMDRELDVGAALSTPISRRHAMEEG
jgi:hypothetical protein